MFLVTVIYLINFKQIKPAAHFSVLMVSFCHQENMLKKLVVILWMIFFCKRQHLLLFVSCKVFLLECKVSANTLTLILTFEEPTTQW